MAIIPAIFPGNDITQAEEARDPYGYTHVEAAEAAQILAQSPQIIILDIRTPAEFNAGHIKGAVNIDYYGKDFEEKIAALDPEAQYLLHCKSGNRSGRSLPLLKEAGVKNVIHLDKGIDGWKALGQQISQK